MTFDKKIYVTQPSLPPLDDFSPYLKKIWKEKWLTNNGRFHQEFEKELADYLGVKYVSLFCNGTCALQIGLQALRITGEVITTPFTFAATTHSIYWNSCTPVFCDIDPVTFNLNPDKVESLITPKTTAILPVHVFGNPCDVVKLKTIADLYGLKLFYDAAHAFGVRKSGESILNFGDLSMLSFHATKVFNTFEGGALVTNDETMKKRIDFLKNFGFAGETTVVAPGVNGKMDEFHSALGLLQLKHIDAEIEKTQKVAQLYEKKMRGIQGISIMRKASDIDYNYAYFPILVDSEKYGLSRDELYNIFRSNEIYARRYFYPLVSNFPCYRDLSSSSIDNLPVATKIAEQILCLPIYADLETKDINRIMDIINKKD
ncbi:MAG: DegT/DnrJ/EryC1/StrS family aminotransferase [Victivallaceae bacterium]